MKGYKVFNPDWTCRGFKYEVGRIYEMKENPVCCEKGFHFCTNLADCFRYYEFNRNNRVAEIETLGEIDSKRNKSCTNMIKIVNEISWIEVLEKVNAGKENSGNRNSGDCNSGNRNSGDCNSGNRNSGDCNSGDCNSGDCNSGDCNSGNYNSGHYNSGHYNSGNYNSGDCNSGNWNSGDCNSGDCNSGNCNSGNWNSGDWNSGDWNSGDWNAINHSSGCFNTLKQNIYLFNKPSLWDYTTWQESFARRILNTMPKGYYEWVDKEDLTDDERNDCPESKTTGGYLRKIKISCEDRQNWYNKLDEQQKVIIKSIPNFDAEIFKEITGIDVNI